MARPGLRKRAARRGPPAKRASLPTSVANAVVAQLYTIAGSGRPDRIATAKTRRKPGALAHPAARGKAPAKRPSLAAAVTSAVVKRLASPAAKRTARRGAKPSLATAVARAVSKRLATAPAARRR